MQCRGWVAGKLIDLETVSTEPLIVIPLGLRLQAADAVVMLQQVMVDVGWKGRLEVCDMPVVHGK